jgi:hypothetical protein
MVGFAKRGWGDLSKILSFLWRNLGEVCWVAVLAFLFIAWVIIPFTKTNDVAGLEIIASTSSLTALDILEFCGIWFICVMAWGIIAYFSELRKYLLKASVPLQGPPDRPRFLLSSRHIVNSLIFAFFIYAAAEPPSPWLPEIYLPEADVRPSMAMYVFIWFLIAFFTVYFLGSEYVKSQEKAWREASLSDNKPD